MTTFEISDHLLSRECDALADEIFAEIMAEADDMTPEDLREDMLDRAHEAADGHEWTIYNHKALMICAHCDVSRGEEFLEDTGMPPDPTIYTIASSIVYGEIRARIEGRLSDLIDQWTDEEDAA